MTRLRGHLSRTRSNARRGAVLALALAGGLRRPAQRQHLLPPGGDRSSGPSPRPTSGSWRPAAPRPTTPPSPSSPARPGSWCCETAPPTSPPSPSSPSPTAPSRRRARHPGRAHGARPSRRLRPRHRLQGRDGWRPHHLQVRPALRGAHRGEKKYGSDAVFERQLAIGRLNDDGTILLLATRRPNEDNLSAPIKGNGSYVVAGPR